MSTEKIVTGYSELQILLKEIGVKFEDDGPAEKNFGKTVSIRIDSAPWSGLGRVVIVFKIDSEGNETYLHQ